MREALIIFRKDVRHLWPRILFLEFWIAVGVFVDAMRPRHMSLVVQPLGILVVVSCLYLLVSAMHEEKTAGDTRYWLTRPIPRRAIVTAKLLFIIAFLVVPIVIGHAVVLAVNGFPQSEYWGGSVWDELLTVLTASVTVWAIASVTVGLVQFVWVGLLWIFGFLAFVFVFQTSESMDWPGFETFRSDLMATALLLIGIAVLWLMYTRRNRTTATFVLGTSAVLLVLLRLLVPWHVAFALKANSGQKVDSNLVRLALDPAARKYSDGLITKSFGGAVGVYIPILLSGIPDGMQVIGDRVSLAINARGEKWKSGWDRLGQLVPPDEPITDPYHQRVTSGPQLLYVNINSEAYERLAKPATHLRATVAFTLYGRPLTVRMPQTDRGRFIPGAGFCSVFYYGNVLAPRCFNAFEPPEAIDLLWRDSPDGAWQYRRSLSVPANPVDIGFFSFWYYGPSLGFNVPYYPHEVWLQVRRPVAYFERTLDIPAIRLADYH